MKKKYNEGFTLVELLVSMVILAAIVIPTCTSLVLSYRMNAKTEKMMQAQLAVSSAVEKLMAEGITDKYLKSLYDIEVKAETEDTYICSSTEFPGLCFELTQETGKPYLSVVVKDEEGQVEVTTHIRDNTSEITLTGVVTK